MKKLYLIMLMAALMQPLNASEYLPFILQAIKANLKPPVNLTYGKIYKVDVQNNKTLILYIDTNTTVTFQKNKVCKLPLFQGIIKEDGTIKYILKGKTKGTYIFNKSTCKEN